MKFEILLGVCVIVIFLLITFIGLFKFGKKDRKVYAFVEGCGLIIIIALTSISLYGYRSSQLLAEKNSDQERGEIEKSVEVVMKESEESEITTVVASDTNVMDKDKKTETEQIKDTESEMETETANAIRIACTTENIEKDGALWAAKNQGYLEIDTRVCARDELSKQFSSNEVDVYLGTVEDLYYCNKELGMKLKPIAVVTRMSQLCIAKKQDKEFANTAATLAYKNTVNEMPGQSMKEKFLHAVLEYYNENAGTTLDFSEMKDGSTIDDVQSENTLITMSGYENPIEEFRTGRADIVIDDMIAIHHLFPIENNSMYIDGVKDCCTLDSTDEIVTMKLLMIPEDEVNSDKVHKLVDALEKGYQDMRAGYRDGYVSEIGTRFAIDKSRQGMYKVMAGDSDEDFRVYCEVYGRVAVELGDFKPTIDESVEDELKTKLENDVEVESDTLDEIAD